jgi:A/G-specific adenine glycosylase
LDAKASTLPALKKSARRAAEPTFAQRVVAWQKNAGRRDLPWQNTRDPYRIWVSEIMLQQTQVSAVIPYFTRFMVRFPTIATLAAAPLGEVTALWSGLGYYARARNLHAAAQQMVVSHGAAFPKTAIDIASLPGIGRSTANAIAAFAFGEPVPILDGNVKRVMARYRAIEGYPGKASVQAQLWHCAEELMPIKANATTIAHYTQGLMDLGAMVCTRRAPQCARCPVCRDCVAFHEQRTHALPAPRPAKPIPLERWAVVVLTYRRRVMLVLRPARGIWGGLWSLPEHDQSATQWAHEALEIPAAQIKTVTPLPEIAHAFTHFKLTLVPTQIALKSAPVNTTAHAQWFAHNQMDTIGLPAPIKRLLHQLFDSDSI